MMTIVLSCVSQKGGVGKSTITRMLAREFANSEWRVLIADTDKRQITSSDWAQVRNDNSVEPEIWARSTVSVERLPKKDFDLIICDGAPFSSRDTLKLAERSDLVLIPTGVSLDDLVPGVRLAHELTANGVSATQVRFVICRAGSAAESNDARAYIESAGYQVIPGDIPERAAYRQAQNQGKAITETRYPSLNKRATEVAQGIVDLVSGENENDGNTKAR